MTAYETGIANSYIKPSLFDKINGSNRCKRQLAKALKKHVAVAKMKDSPIMPIEKDWVRIWVETHWKDAGKVMLGDDRVMGLENSFLGDKNETAGDFNEDNVNDRKEIGHNLIQMRPVWRQRENAADYNIETVADESTSRKGFVRCIDILPSKVNGEIIDGQHRFEKTEQNPKTSIINMLKTDSRQDVDYMETRSKIDEAPRRPCDDVSRDTFMEDDILNSSSHQSKIAEMTTPTEGSFQKENNEKGRDVIQKHGLTAMQERKGQNNNPKEACSKENRSRLLHSLKHLLRRNSDPFTNLQAQLSSRNSPCEKIRYHSIHINDMTSLTDVENELNKLAVNLSKLNNEICEIKSGVEAGLTITISMLNAERGSRESML